MLARAVNEGTKRPREESFSGSVEAKSRRGKNAARVLWKEDEQYERDAKRWKQGVEARDFKDSSITTKAPKNANWAPCN